MMVIYVGIGGALGAVSRYLMVSAAGRLLGTGFPYGTLLVNILGSLLMGLLAGYGAHRYAFSPEMRALLAVGFLGGFTTFSAFSLDVTLLFERHQMLPAFLYILFSVTLSVLALAAGLWLMRQMAGA